tara:strand:+ start:76 stop:276 length:201 start_codon:yes stop_codon:yes gene_type:complete
MLSTLKAIFIPIIIAIINILIISGILYIILIIPITSNKVNVKDDRVINISPNRNIPEDRYSRGFDY